ncbi:MAG: transaldolase [Acidimicrobiales bacterium]
MAGLLEPSVKIFADGADLDSITRLASDPRISGFTTNPTLMHKAGLSNYEAFAKEVLTAVHTMPVSFEVCADDFESMKRQARTIAGWGENVYVKVPVTTTRGESTRDVVRRLAGDGVQVNVTAIFTIPQVEVMTEAVRDGAPSNLSLFAGRIADAGVDPVPVVREAVAVAAAVPETELIWASPREVLNVVQAAQAGCHIITMTSDLLAKLDGLGRDLTDFSLETVRMFHRDAARAGLDV